MRAVGDVVIIGGIDRDAERLKEHIGDQGVHGLRPRADREDQQHHNCQRPLLPILNMIHPAVHRAKLLHCNGRIR